MTTDSFLPPFPVLEEAIGSDLKDGKSGRSLRVSVHLLEMLIKAALAAEGFDEGAYLACNADLEPAWRSGSIKDLRQHYLGVGYFEGRKSGAHEFDEGWYLSRYRDVAEAVLLGQIKSGRDHFEKIGYREWRAPNEQYARQMQAWRETLGDLRKSS